MNHYCIFCNSELTMPEKASFFKNSLKCHTCTDTIRYSVSNDVLDIAYILHRTDEINYSVYVLKLFIISNSMEIRSAKNINEPICKIDVPELKLELIHSLTNKIIQLKAFV